VTARSGRDLSCRDAVGPDRRHQPFRGGGRRPPAPGRRTPVTAYPDFQPSGNAAVDPIPYEMENEAFDSEGLVLAAMRDLAHARSTGAQVLAGSAGHLPLPDASVDVIHARFAYFFPPGCDAGLAEALRALRLGGTLVVVDNDRRDHGGRVGGPGGRAGRGARRVALRRPPPPRCRARRTRRQGVNSPLPDNPARDASFEDVSSFSGSTCRYLSPWVREQEDEDQWRSRCGRVDGGQPP
jgi:SAM-dependent methyltransferase